MSLSQFAFFAPLLSVATFFFFETIILARQTQWPKLFPFAAIQGINLAVSLCLSLFLLIPFVFLITPLQVFSFSSWQVPIWVSFSASLLFLDFVQYWSHRLHHKMHFLWRLHRLHHSDRHVDALTTLLHHPLELVSGFFFTTLAAVMFDVPMIVLISYSGMLGFHSGFTHMNHELPLKLDRVLRWFFVSPNFHRIHHSLNLKESNLNFGSLFVYWDYLFRTISVTEKNSSQSVFGIDKNQSPVANSLGSCLINPVK
jgi:sterol desaturase/sphingolipid hydroxylase (fatty acid hydroxylase superfamily)